MYPLKRYTSFSAALKRQFGCKVQRVAVDGGFSCPNRDGHLDTAGCIFCGGHGSGSYGILRDQSIHEQLRDGCEVMRRKHKADKFIAYFQAYSNTYAPLEQLREQFCTALNYPQVVGLMVATRPDCLPDDILDYLAELNRQTYFWLELGLQSMHDRSLKLLNRCHHHACSVAAVQRAKQRGLRVCAHVMLGLPSESRTEMLAMAGELNRLGVDGVKLQLLHVMRRTRLAEMYGRGEVKLLDRDEYAGIVCDFLEALDPQVQIHRLTGDGGRADLVAPLWSLNKFVVLNLIDAEMERRGTRQGSAFHL